MRENPHRSLAAGRLRKFELLREEWQQFALEPFRDTIPVITLVKLKSMLNAQARELLLKVDVHGLERILVSDIHVDCLILL